VTAAVTAPAGLADAGARLSSGVQGAARNEAKSVSALTDFGTPADHVRQVSGHPAESGHEAVGGPSPESLPACSGNPVRNHANHAGGRLSPQAAAALLRGLPDGSGQGSPVSATSGESGWRPVATAAVEALDGSDRKLLLARLADSDPDVVVAGLTWLQQWHEANAERRAGDRRRKAKDRRRRQRANRNAATRAA
jgi:hypothetical protein